MLALDATLPVVEEAGRQGADLLITHHPVIFHPLKKVSADSAVYRLIQLGITVISAHTNLDVAQDGVNDQLARALGLTQISPFSQLQKEPYYKLEILAPQTGAQKMLAALVEAGAVSGRLCAGACPGEAEAFPQSRIELSAPREKLPGVLAAMRAAHPDECPAFDLYENQGVWDSYSLGRMGRLPKPVSPEAFALHVKKCLGCTGVRLGRGGDRIATVAVCGGSGGSLIGEAIRAGADALVTSDLKHDQYLTAAEAGLTLVDAGHHSTETVVLPPLMEHLRKRFPEVEFFIAPGNREPFTCL